MSSSSPSHFPAVERLVTQVAAAFEPHAEVEAVALDGSLATGSADSSSDADFGVYLSSSPAPERECEIRSRIQPTLPIVLGAGIFKTHDILITPGGLRADISYYLAPAAEEAIHGALIQPSPALVRTSDLCALIRDSRILFDRTGWLKKMQEITSGPYPEALRTSIMARHWQMLAHPVSSFQQQMCISAARGDLPGWRYYSDLFITSYFQIVFAANRVLNSNRKRLMEIARRSCAVLPANFEEIEQFILSPPGVRSNEIAGRLVNGLRELME